MKAQLNEDFIASIGTGVEIGKLPKGVGLERLRFDGESVVDLIDRSEYWVRARGNSFELHVIPVVDSQLIQMSFFDRKYLSVIDGSIFVIPNELRNEHLLTQSRDELKARLRQVLKKKVGDRDDQIADTAKILSMLISAVVSSDPASLAALAELQPLMAELYSPADTIGTLKERATALKNTVGSYYQQKKQI